MSWVFPLLVGGRRIGASMRPLTAPSLASGMGERKRVAGGRSPDLLARLFGAAENWGYPPHGFAKSKTLPCSREVRRRVRVSRLNESRRLSRSPNIERH